MGSGANSTSTRMSANVYAIRFSHYLSSLRYLWLSYYLFGLVVTLYKFSQIISFVGYTAWLPILTSVAIIKSEILGVDVIFTHDRLISIKVKPCKLHGWQTCKLASLVISFHQLSSESSAAFTMRHLCVTYNVKNSNANTKSQ